MKVEFDVIEPNLLIHRNDIYINVLKEELVPFARDVNEIVKNNIGTFLVRESDAGVMSKDSKKKNSKERIPLSEYLLILEQNQKSDNFGFISCPSYNFFGAGDYLIDAWTLQNLEINNLTQFISDKSKLENLKDILKQIKDDFGTLIEEPSAKNYIEERLAKLEKGIPERYSGFWVITGLAPNKSLKQFLDDKIFAGVIRFNGINKNDEIISKTKNELVEKLRN